MKSAAPSQKFIEIQDIKDDLVILKNGGLRAVLIASSINFELKNSEEQEALIIRFQGFLNSLDFPIQILISSRKLDISPYLNGLQELARTQENELLHTQTIEYMDFIQKFVEVVDIMNKSFYVVIPYNPMGTEKEKIWDKFKFAFRPKQAAKTISPEKLREYKDQLYQRISHIANGLAQVEIKTSSLTTDQLIRLFYEFYNPRQ